LRNAQRMDRLIGNILDTARFRSGDTTLSLDNINVPEMVREVEETTQPSLLHRKQKLTVNLPPDLPALRGDFDLLRRTLTNLLDNASKFSPARGSLELTLIYDEEAFRFTIVDSGPGVAFEDRERIFDLYSRGQGQQSSGAGIGLAFCKLVVEAHGGRIWVDNPGEEGAIFVFTIPREIPTEAMYFRGKKS
ncbi:MAG: sensor histidine kinase, partial [Anaerolineae bacterium]